MRDKGPKKTNSHFGKFKRNYGNQRNHYYDKIKNKSEYLGCSYFKENTKLKPDSGIQNSPKIPLYQDSKTERQAEFTFLLKFSLYPGYIKTRKAIKN